jgi:hypothetical protein
VKKMLYYDKKEGKMITQNTIEKFKYYSRDQHHASMMHLNTMYHYGKRCKKIVEMGVENAFSTWAWLAAKPKYLRAVDIYRNRNNHPNWLDVENEAKAMGIDFRFEIADSGHGALREIYDRFFPGHGEEGLNLPPYVMDKGIELLFIDTYHSYTHLKAELAVHGNRVRKYLMFHDTETFGESHPYDGDLGLNPAIREFISSNPHWIYLHKVNYGHGLTVLGNTKNMDDKPNMDPELMFPDPDFF